MAKIHSKKRGKSGKITSKDPVPPKWIEMSPDEVKKKIIELGKKGHSSAEIGMILRDEYGVPNVKAVTGKRIVAILNEAGIKPKIPEDLINLMKRAVSIHNHLKTHKSDIHNRVKYEHTKSLIYRLVKYYKREGVLPKDWKYSIETAALLVK